MKIDLTFKTNYSLEFMRELRYGDIYYYPGANKKGGQDGILLKIICENKEWVGLFSFGSIDRNGLTGVYATPDPDRFCVISKGAGYIVSANNPEEWNNVKVTPIINVHVVKNQNIIVFADYTKLTAYDAKDVKWITERLALDGFKIIKITDDLLVGEYWNMSNEKEQLFEVDLLTGKQTGGIGSI